MCPCLYFFKGCYWLIPPFVSVYVFVLFFLPAWLRLSFFDPPSPRKESSLINLKIMEIKDCYASTMESTAPLQEELDAIQNQIRVLKAKRLENGMERLENELALESRIMKRILNTHVTAPSNTDLDKLNEEENNYKKEMEAIKVQFEYKSVRILHQNHHIHSFFFMNIFIKSLVLCPISKTINIHEFLFIFQKKLQDIAETRRALDDKRFLEDQRIRIAEHILTNFGAQANITNRQIQDIITVRFHCCFIGQVV